MNEKQFADYILKLRQQYEIDTNFKSSLEGYFSHCENMTMQNKLIWGVAYELLEVVFDGRWRDTIKKFVTHKDLDEIISDGKPINELKKFFENRKQRNTVMEFEKFRRFMRDLRKQQYLDEEFNEVFKRALGLSENILTLNNPIWLAVAELFGIMFYDFNYLIYMWYTCDFAEIVVGDTHIFDEESMYNYLTNKQK